MTPIPAGFDQWGFDKTLFDSLSQATGTGLTVSHEDRTGYRCRIFPQTYAAVFLKSRVVAASDYSEAAPSRL